MHNSINIPESPRLRLTQVPQFGKDSYCLEPLTYIRSNLTIVINLTCVEALKKLLTQYICRPEEGKIQVDDLFLDPEENENETPCDPLVDKDSFPLHLDEGQIECVVTEFLSDGVALLAMDSPYIKCDAPTIIEFKTLDEWNQAVFTKATEQHFPLDQLSEAQRFILSDSNLRDKLLSHLLVRGDKNSEVLLEGVYSCKDIFLRDSVYLEVIKENPLQNITQLNNIENEDIKIQACRYILCYCYQNDRDMFNQLIWDGLEEFNQARSQQWIHKFLLLVFQLQFSIEENKRSELLQLLNENLSKMTDSQREEIISCIINNAAFDEGFRIAVVEQNVDDPNIRESLTQSLGDSDDRKRLAHTKSSRK